MASFSCLLMLGGTPSQHSYIDPILRSNTSFPPAAAVGMTSSSMGHHQYGRLKRPKGADPGQYRLLSLLCGDAEDPLRVTIE